LGPGGTVWDEKDGHILGVRDIADKNILLPIGGVFIVLMRMFAAGQKSPHLHVPVMKTGA
jgi:hypothetical protein